MKARPQKNPPRRAQPLLWVLVVGLLAVMGVLLEKAWRTYETLQAAVAKDASQVVTGHYAVMFFVLGFAGFLGAAIWAVSKKALGK